MPTLARAPHPDRPDSVVTLTEVGTDPTSVPDAPCDMLRAAIAQQGGYCDWTVDHTGWVVTLHYPESRTFFGLSLEDALAWCLLSVVEREGGDRAIPR